MDEVTNALPSEGEAISVEQAVGLLHAPEKPRDDKGRFAGQQNNEPAAVEDDGAAETELPSDEDDNLAQPEEAATEEDQGNDPAEEPPLDLPRSWSKDRAEHWAKLDRETQQFLLDHDSKASAEVRRAQNEAAERIKSIDAERQAYEQARQQYESRLPQLLDRIQDEYHREFPDGVTDEQLARMPVEDPINYLKYLSIQQRWQATQAEQAQAQQQRQQEYEANFAQWKAEETQRLLSIAPEFADPKKVPQLVAQARETLADVNVSDEEIKALTDGAPINFHDHRFQLILRKAMRYDAAQKALKTAAPKPAPQVQRPGTAPAKGEARNAQLEALSSRLNKTHSVDDAVRLWQTRSRRA